ncbi:MAG: SIMPL domain-containing protein [Panacibacter sp.]
MKKIMTFVVMVFVTAQLMAQELRPVQKTISVSGSAETEVTPDEIYVQVDLREYNKKNGDKIDINTIKNQFLDACKSIGLNDKDVTIQGYQGYDNNYWLTKKNKKQNPDLKASISYWIKVSTTAKLDALVDKMDDEATQNFFIAKTAYSQMDNLKKDMKITAAKAAREKAIYLSEALGERLGETITINDPVEIDNTPRPYYANTTVKMFENAEAAPALNVDFKKLKLRFEVNVVFSLK